MCYRLYDAAVANEAMQRLYDRDANDKVKIKRLRKKIRRYEKKLEFVLLRQNNKKMQSLNNNDDIGLDQIVEGVFEHEEEMEIAEAGVHEEGGIDEEEEQVESPLSVHVEGPRRRNKWTAAEINYVQNWIDVYPNLPVGELYRHILGDTHAVAEIFHWRHIACVGRLDYMFKKCRKGL